MAECFFNANAVDAWYKTAETKSTPATFASATAENAPVPLTGAISIRAWASSAPSTARPIRGKCFRHGGSKFCKMEGCVTYARNRGYCTRHTPPHLVARRSSVVKTEVKVENILPDHSLDLMLDFDPLVDTFDISPAPQLEHVTPTDWGVLVSLLAGSSN
ncbi:hypothetical protein LEN26_007452 [Aphanomyces euteiches]|nr:hypothetical protein AeMF1_007888 [Aphanomyces euteiches]KAH9132306.1 hypothetical protein LEN26_007452 [Aphanomyces euteiches]KAH9189365.1 hypothetical protein AeNC1_008660 [Aphanomyces euteiches]